jgi:hypothetical protein
MVRQSAYRSACWVTLLTTIALAVGSTGGCGSTQQVNRWVDPSYNAAPLKKVLVIAMRKDQLRRRMWEDAFVTTLSSKEHAGTVAVASYQFFPDRVPDTLAIRLKTTEEGCDGVLLVAAAQRDTLTTDVPGYTTNERVTEYSRMWHVYVTRYEDVYHPGYVETETITSVRTDVLLAQEDGKLVWSVTSQSVDVTSADQFRKSVASRVVSLLKKEHFVY